MKKALLFIFYFCGLSLPVMGAPALGTPSYDDIEWPDDEEASPALIKLGKTLFFDPRLVPNGQQSCGSCHDPSTGLSDGMAKDFKGHSKWKQAKRNSPMISNLAWEPIIHWDGRTPSDKCFTPEDTKEEVCFPPLEAQAFKSMKKRKIYTHFMAKISVLPEYQQLFKAAFPPNGEITHANMAWAIGAFERSLVSNDSPFDKYLAGNPHAMNDSAIRGMKLFKEKANCMKCHNGPNFSDSGFHNIGLKGDDRGRAKILEKNKDKDFAKFEGAFRTPGLRNTALTAPYMHDGRLGTLEKVVRYYNKGGDGHINQSNQIKPLNLTDKEEWDLVMFLHALTDPVEIEMPIIPKAALTDSVDTKMSATPKASSEIETLVKMLHKNGTVNDRQYGRLMSEIKVTTEKTTVTKEQMQAKLGDASKTTFEIDKGGMQVNSSDGEFSAKIGGRVQVDSAWYDEKGSEMGNGTEIRRGRLYLQGKMFNDWGYKLQYDFTGTGRGGIKDAFLTYNGFDHIELKAGNFKNPFMLQEQTSSKYITFTERSLLDAFSDSRHIGVMASTKHKHWTAAAGFFGNGVNTSSKGKDEGWGVNGRTTYAPFNEKTRLIHLGAAVSYREVGDRESIRFKQQPETHVSGTNIVDTGIIAGGEKFLKFGAELAAVEGPFSIQSEYIWTTVDRDNGNDLDFDGWYAEAAYFLTGESLKYKKGKFGGVSPKSIVGRNGIGAWQFATRYSSIDLNDRDIQGGEADSVTIGINWFPTSTLRFSANYVNVLDVDGGKSHGEEPNLIQIRGQWAF